MPFLPISKFYKERFGQKVFKIPVALAEDCPNRRGLRGMKTCIFCDVHGSFAYPENQQKTLEEQILRHREKVAKRFKAARFLLYFQAYTSTFLQLGKLRSAFELSEKFDDIVGVVVGTRPDCLSSSVLDLWLEQAAKKFFTVEFGVQSFSEERLIWMRRGHTAGQSRLAINRVHERLKIPVGIHLIFGWPGETDREIIEAARACNDLPLHNVKLHNLHVLKNTALEEVYNKGEFKPLELQHYSERVGLFLSYLRSDIYVHRLAAVASQWNELVAPEWTRGKMQSYQFILDYLNTNKIDQGMLRTRFKSESIAPLAHP